MATQPLTEIEGIGEITATKLHINGIMTAKAVAKAKVEDLMAATDFPINRVKLIKEAATALVKEQKAIKKAAKAETKAAPEKSQKKKKKKGKKDKDKKKKKK